MKTWKEQVSPFFESIKSKMLEEAKQQEIKGHWGTIGDGREEILKKSLKPFLPASYRLSKSVIYDSRGSESSPEFDLVLSNLFWSDSVMDEERKPLFIENVVAIFEVKTNVDGEAIKTFDENLTKLSKLVRVFHPTTVLTLFEANQALTCRLAEGVVEKLSLPKGGCELSYIRPHQQQEPVVVGALSSGPEMRPVVPIKTAIFGYKGVSEKTLLQHLHAMNNRPDLVVVLNTGVYQYHRKEQTFAKMNPEPHHLNLEFACLTMMVSEWINRSTDDRILLRGHLTDYL